MYLSLLSSFGLLGFVSLSRWISNSSKCVLRDAYWFSNWREGPREAEAALGWRLARIGRWPTGGPMALSFLDLASPIRSSIYRFLVGDLLTYVGHNEVRR